MTSLPRWIVFTFTVTATIASASSARADDTATSTTSDAPATRAGAADGAETKAPPAGAPAPDAASVPAPDTPAPATKSGPPRTRFVYRTLNVFRLNPIGLISDNHVAMRYRLFEPDDLLFKDTYIGLGVTPSASPAFGRIGALFEVQPIVPVRAYFAYEVIGYFGLFNLFQSFPSASSDYSDTQLGALGDLPEGDARRPYATGGSQLTLGLDLQIKLGPVAVRNLSRLVRGDYAMRQGDRVYYDLTYDVLVPNRGFFLNNDSDLLYVSDFGLVAGVRVNTTHPLYGREHFSPSETETQVNLNGPTLRGGPIAIYSFADGEGTYFTKPSLLVSVQWFGAHRFRTGADVNQLFPYIVVGFMMNGDLQPWK